MRLQRLLRMSFGEIGGRARQESWKWLERAGVGAAAATRRGEATSGAVTTGRFFPGPESDATPELITRRDPAARDGTLRAAEAILGQRFDLLGYRGLFFGNPVDWHLDPISRRRAPLHHWSRIDPLDEGVVGDSKVIWELNRHQWLVALGQAHLLTGDERYARAGAALLGGWRAANPYRAGINWASSLEVALRLIAWSWARALFRRSATLTPALRIELQNGIRLHAAHVERYLSRYFSPNTHLTGEALGLVYAGLHDPDLPESRRWREAGAGILEAEIERQVLPDGVHFEQATCYHRYTVEIYLHYLILAERNGLAVPQRLRERVVAMLDALIALRRPDGTVPSIGDADGGWLLPLSRRDRDDVRGLFSTAAVLFGRGDYAWAAGGPAPETIWMLGPEGLRAFEELRPEPPAAAPSMLLPDSGYAVMRSGWDGEAHQLIFDAGPIGCPISAGHGHADLLSIQCSVFGRPYLVDPGTYCYTPRPRWRDHFRSTAAHSSLLVDGGGQAEPAGAFTWRARPQARLMSFSSDARFDRVLGEHDAYAGPPDPVRHRRRVIFVKPRYFHRAELIFQFAPMRVALEESGWCRAHGGRSDALLIRAFSNAALEAAVVRGAVDPPRGWASPDYGQRRPAPALIYGAAAKLPLRIATLLLPLRDPRQPAPTATPIAGSAGDPEGFQLEWPGGVSERVRFDTPAEERR